MSAASCLRQSARRANEVPGSDGIACLTRKRLNKLGCEQLRKPDKLLLVTTSLRLDLPVTQSPQKPAANQERQRAARGINKLGAEVIELRRPFFAG